MPIVPLALNSSPRETGAKSAAEASEPSETRRVRQIKTKKMGATATIASGAIASAVPKPVAIPRPPLKPTQIERVEPSTAKSAAHTTHQLAVSAAALDVMV